LHPLRAGVEDWVTLLVVAVVVAAAIVAAELLT
jgi:hypothetical protein